MSKSILIHENGGPEKMQLHDVEVGAPGPGQVKIRHTAIGLNFIDVYTRSGLYPNPMPHAVGREAAGVIVQVGPKVRGFKKGDRVAYCGELGAYCQERLMGVNQLVHVPKGVSDEQAAAIMLKGMTTEYLVDHTAKAWLKNAAEPLAHAMLERCVPDYERHAAFGWLYAERRVSGMDAALRERVSLALQRHIEDAEFAGYHCSGLATVIDAAPEAADLEIVARARLGAVSAADEIAIFRRCVSRSRERFAEMGIALPPITHTLLGSM